MHNDLPEAALEYCIAAGDVDAAAELVGMLAVPTYQQGRVITVLGWFRWLDNRGGIAGHLKVAVMAGLISVDGPPAESGRADAVDRWQNGDARARRPPAEAWAAALRAVICRHGVEQMHADAEEAARRFAAQGIRHPIPTLLRG